MIKDGIIMTSAIWGDIRLNPNSFQNIRGVYTVDNSPKFVYVKDNAIPYTREIKNIVEDAISDIAGSKSSSWRVEADKKIRITDTDNEINVEYSVRKRLYRVRTATESYQFFRKKDFENLIKDIERSKGRQIIFRKDNRVILTTKEYTKYVFIGKNLLKINLIFETISKNSNIIVDTLLKRGKIEVMRELKIALEKKGFFPIAD